MAERHGGTDIANIRTNAEIKGDRVVIEGTKTLISKVDEAQLFVVFTRVNKTPGHRRDWLCTGRARHPRRAPHQALSHDGR